MSATVRKPLPFRFKEQVVREHPLQREITKVLAIELAPAGRVSPWGVCWYAIDHAHYAGINPGARIGRGIVAGIADVFVIWRGRAHFVELKAADGILSEPQQAVMSALLAAGGQCGIACSSPDVLRLLDAWHVPRSGRTGIVGRAQPAREAVS
jgi:hypothetical protein